MRTGLEDLLSDAGFPVEASGDALVLKLRGGRRRRVEVTARALPDGVASFVCPLPDAPRSGADQIPSRLLRMTMEEAYAKGVILDSGAWAVAAEVPLEALRVDDVKAIIGGTAPLADLRRRDLGRDKRWEDARSRARSSPLMRFQVDVKRVRREIVDLLRGGGLPFEEREDGALFTSLDLAGESHLVIIHVDPTAISFTTFPEWLRAGPGQPRTQRRLLELNRLVTVAKVGLDARYEAAILYQVPGTFPGLLAHAAERLGALVTAVDEAGTDLWGT